MSVGQDELQDTALYSARLEETAKARGGVGRGVVGQLTHVTHVSRPYVARGPRHRLRPGASCICGSNALLVFQVEIKQSCQRCKI